MDSQIKQEKWISKPEYVDRLHDYQEEAINNWEYENFQGIFDMATGERVIIVMGAINALESRVLGTLTSNNSFKIHSNMSIYILRKKFIMEEELL